MTKAGTTPSGGARAGISASSVGVNVVIAIAAEGLLVWRLRGTEAQMNTNLSSIEVVSQHCGLYINHHDQQILRRKDKNLLTSLVLFTSRAAGIRPTASGTVLQVIGHQWLVYPHVDWGYQAFGAQESAAKTVQHHSITTDGVLYVSHGRTITWMTLVL